jgi:hypothetical protein
MALSTDFQPLITRPRWAAMTRATGVLATFRTADGTYTANCPVIPDRVDVQAQLDTGIAAGTPIVEALALDILHPATGEPAFKNGDTLSHSGRTWRIHGSPMTDDTAGTVTYTLSRTPTL